MARGALYDDARRATKRAYQPSMRNRTAALVLMLEVTGDHALDAIFDWLHPLVGS